MKKLLTIAAAIGMIGGAASASTVISFETDELGFSAVGSENGVNTGGAAVRPTSGFDGFTVDADTFNISSFSGSGFNISLNNEVDIEITQNNEGLGVDNNNGPFGLDNSNVDGSGSNDILIFSFDKAVRLLNVVFENVGDGDDFVFYNPDADPTSFQADIINPLAFPDTDGDEGNFNFGGQIVTTFGIGALDGFSFFNDGVDRFRVSRIEVAPVPLPASALLLVGGLAGLGALRRRKKAS